MQRAREFGRGSVVLLAAGAPPCQETNPEFDGATGTAGVESSGSVGDSGLDSAPTSSNSGAETGSGSGSGAGDVTGDATAAVSDGPAEATQGTSSGGGDPGSYPPCMLGADPECPRPWDACFDEFDGEYTVCSQTCARDGDCPAPESGAAVPVCAGPGDDDCVLDCEDGACPDGMECVGIGPGGNSMRCAWPV